MQNEERRNAFAVFSARSVKNSIDLSAGGRSPRLRVGCEIPQKLEQRVSKFDNRGPRREGHDETGRQTTGFHFQTSAARAAVEYVGLRCISGRVSGSIDGR